MARERKERRPRRHAEPCTICKVPGGFRVRRRHTGGYLSKEPKSYAAALAQLHGYEWRAHGGKD